MKHDLRHSEESAINHRALVKAAGVGGLVMMIAWLGSMMFPPAFLTTFLWIVGGTLLAAVVSAFLAGRLCGLRRREDGVAHGILSWFVVMFFTALMMLPSVNAIDLGAPQSSLLDRVKVLAVEAGADDHVAADRAQLARLLRGFGVAADTATLATIAQYAASGDSTGMQTYLGTQLNLEPDNSAVIADHALTLYRDTESADADQAVLQENIMTLATTLWWLLLGVSGSLLLSIWAGAHGVRVSGPPVR